MKIVPLPTAVPTPMKALHLKKPENAEKPENPLRQYAGARASRHPVGDKIATATMIPTKPAEKPPEVPVCYGPPPRGKISLASIAVDEPTVPICTAGPGRKTVADTLNILS